MKSIMDYSKLQLKETKKIKVVKTYTYSTKYFMLQILILILFLSILSSYFAWYGALLLCTCLFISKLIRDCCKKQRFNFLPEPDKNYIEMPYKNKFQAIEAKVTCHPESNPVRIMQNESNRLYVLSNTSGSLFSTFKY